MAVRFNAISEQLTRTTDLPSLTDYTVMAWIRVVANNGLGDQNIINRGNSWSNYMFIGFDSSLTLRYYDSANSGGITGSTLSTGVWRNIAMTRATNVRRVYLDGVADISPADAAITINSDELNFGSNDGGEWTDMRMGAIKVWAATLTAAEIRTEMWHYCPKRHADLHAFWPLLSTADDEIDYSKNGRTLTVTGTLGTEEGPPIGWRPRRRPGWSTTEGIFPPPNTTYVVRHPIYP